LFARCNGKKWKEVVNISCRFQSSQVSGGRATKIVKISSALTKYVIVSRAAKNLKITNDSMFQSSLKVNHRARGENFKSK
jgi:hypothetical protein